MALGKLYMVGKNDQSEKNNLDEVASKFGLIVEEQKEVEEDLFYLWPECVATFDLWLRIQTQWDVDFNGRWHRLNYQAVSAFMDMAGIRKKDKKKLFEEFQCMEAEVLIELRKRS